MSVLLVPNDADRKDFTTLGHQVAEWIERHLVHGPGDLRGDPVRLDDEKLALLLRLYEVFPRGHQFEGRRRFNRAGISLRKGVAKTEFGAMIAAAELSEHGPVRTVGWKGREPIGGPVRDPYIPLVAYTAEQAEDLAFQALLVMLEEGPLAEEFSLGVDSITRAAGDGKAAFLATAPNARDGARTTFQMFDETHRFVLPKLREAHRTMLANIPKRAAADAWTLETTTAPEPGGGSIAEDTFEYARAIEQGRVADARLFYFHRQAGPLAPSPAQTAAQDRTLSTARGLRRAVVEATGRKSPFAARPFVDGILALFADPTQDRRYLRRVFLNQLVRAASAAFDVQRWDELADADHVVPEGAAIALGFDGSRFDDGTALVATEIETGFQWLAGLWERPFAVPPGLDWQVPEHEVDECVDDLFQRFVVWRFYADPPYWETNVATWAARYGSGPDDRDRVVAWPTYRERKMATAIRSFVTALQKPELKHDGSRDLRRHLGNSRRRPTRLRTEEGEALWLLEKERQDSPLKIDAAMAAILSWEARIDAIGRGAGAAPQPSVYEERGVIVV